MTAPLAPDMASSETTLSPHELDERFDLLVADEREYAIFLVSREGIIRCWNPGAERLWGYSSPESSGSIGQNNREFTPFAQTGAVGLDPAVVHFDQHEGRADSAARLTTTRSSTRSLTLFE